MHGPAAVRVERGWALVGGAVCRGRLLLEDTAGASQERAFDVVVGADGVHSTTRALMADEVRPNLQQPDARAG